MEKRVLRKLEDAIVSYSDSDLDRTRRFGESALGQTPSHAPPTGMTCPGDKLVWVNSRSHIYHFQDERYFGSTQQGKFMCERQADKATGRRTTGSEPPAGLAEAPAGEAGKWSMVVNDN